MTVNNKIDYKKLNGACDIFYKWAYRGHILGQIKEKYGTTRWYAYLTEDQWPIYSLFKPCYIYYTWPKWMMDIDNFLGQYIVNPLFGKLIVKWKIYCYRQAYMECAKKLGPIHHCIDYDEFFTKEELKRITTETWEAYE